MFHPFSLSQGASSSEQVSAPLAPSLQCLSIHLEPSCSIPPQTQLMSCLPAGPCLRQPQKGPLSLKQWKITPLHKVLTWSHLEAFSQDSSLVRKIREEYFRRHSPHINTENTCNLWGVFWHMAETTELLGSTIYKIKEVWTGLDELQQANYMLRTLPKGLKFLRVVSPSESPKVMGLMGIHDPNTLHHFNRVTHCPWWKEGQNEGTVINHFQTVHYRLGLMCKKCFGCLSTSLEAIHCHSQKGGRPWWVILIGKTASRRCIRSISPKQEPGQRIQGRFWHPSRLPYWG